VKLEEFFDDLMNGVHARAEIDRDYTQSAFFNEMAERLVDAEEIDGLTPVLFTGTGQRGRRLAVSGYDVDDSDGSVALAVLDFEDSPTPGTLAEAEARRMYAALEKYVEEAIDGTFHKDREESSPEVSLAEMLRRRGRTITRFRLYLLSNRVLSRRAKDFTNSSIAETPVEYHVWDIERLHRLHESNQGRETVQIDLREWAPAGVPALQVSDGRSTTETYLCALPGRLLADLYGRYGSRLLEGNVRSYLSARGNVNKGIKTTVLSEPDLFIAYNNGITATATGVTVDDTGAAIIGLEDLQIVNGGQTTASLFFVAREQRDAAQLDDVSVQAKVVVVTRETARELVPNISRRANSQNKVSEADFFSNSPFHVRMEELSRRILTPPRAGVSFQTKWFYERTRGQYLNEKSKLSTGDEKRFTAEYPRKQVITKTDAAKYAVSWAQRPHLVSRGAQKNFVEFAKDVAERWDAKPEDFNETFFRQIVGQAILYNEIRAAVANADWYESGYLANIVTYTVAKLAAAVAATGSDEFDWGAVWQRQGISDATREFALRIALQVRDVLTDDQRPVVNVTEWAKRDACWGAVRDLRIDLPDAMAGDLVDREASKSQRRSARVQQTVDDGIQAQAAVLATDAREWTELECFCKTTRLLTDKDVGILALVTARRPGLPSELQAKHLLGLRDRAVAHGYRYRKR
jgi:hypothetical protein